MKKTLIIVLMFILSMILASCGGTTINVAPSEITTKIIQDFTDVEMSEITEDRISLYYDDIDLSVIDEFSCYIEGSGGFADEVAVFKTKSRNDTSKVKKAIESRVERRTNDFTNYNSWELSKIENYSLIVKDNYVLFLISEDNAKAENVFNSYFK